MYRIENGILLCTLPNGSSISQDRHPETNASITIDNARDVLQACIPEDQWQALLKREGVEFEGVMCSATKDDQNGLMAVLMASQLQGALFAPTRYDFSNGNSLVLSQTNMQQFIDVWMPFRQSFFIPE